MFCMRYSKLPRTRQSWRGVWPFSSAARVRALGRLVLFGGEGLRKACNLFSGNLDNHRPTLPPVTGGVEELSAGL